MQQVYFKETEFLTSTIDFNHQDTAEKVVLDIAYGVDQNFLFGCGISIASVLKNNTDKTLHFHVFIDAFNETDRRMFDKLAAQYKTHITIYLINCEHLRSLPSTKNWTYAIYFRFAIADYFIGKTNKLLYLDADIICQGGIDELVNFSFASDKIAAVVTEGKADWWEKRALSLGTEGITKGYFNSGLILINLNQWAIECISARAIKMLSDPDIVGRITHPDQDVLNILLADKLHFLDIKFNTQFSLNYQLKDKFINPVNNDTILIHYIGPTKPWHSWAGDYLISKPFIDAKQASPWKNTALLKPTNSNQFRYCAKHMLKNKRYIKGMVGYFLYFMKKITNR
ncbi:lipopolysaccharide 3-alpha-galactosyltransferase [Citrobacter rodentium]|jgi:Lipopolysaccharide biosynthesis proteins, LPS:glycosyltransferases|uniref:UDP-galactose:(Glucosyl) LPS alpha-1,3-galactosyltransferase n=2 Tax=Citrobacter rodentium TaxID=67825 RepID=D2TIX6_CITRI|nr:lipopolysaccharide 3-alpha-galactosyltransferase [Citrobacter rodentium]KIQ50537.1 lipopolysaccharide 1,3-galactosyltransferase [Citrobacter rodentium]QBY30478.1 lipopolysaccharide 3-alpha-galactosyltransferase [Citrobacter rodentium]UHO32151.1 lipopolysaccharide 3-alpha-galactosyltransferase [Citrobacter rodentium NBRC 105723 = DSM 16636]CBG90888.1 UDP-galactose:(glucosyl) LPS alpha-1,3-galactosyltransferase [Citrobacter rodentium ICC168]HAT8013124.1 lipopolysaccharide 1,3-galactosyltransf